MLKNYLAIALRSMRRHVGYPALNVFGLAAGLAAFILILLFVQHELTWVSSATGCFFRGCLRSS